MQPMWAGIAGAPVNGNKDYEVALSIHDSVYNTDFNSTLLGYDANNSEHQSNVIEDYVVSAVKKFSSEHQCKFLGAGITVSLLKEVRNLFFFAID